MKIGNFTGEDACQAGGGGQPQADHCESGAPITFFCDAGDVCRQSVVVVLWVLAIRRHGRVCAGKVVPCTCASQAVPRKARSGFWVIPS